MAGSHTFSMARSHRKPSTLLICLYGERARAVRVCVCVYMYVCGEDF